MGRHSNSSSYSSRPASRRLPRSFSVTALPPYYSAVFPGIPEVRSTQTFKSFCDGSEQGNPIFELRKARRRIAELEKILEETSSAAFVDPLTGALNRRGFERAYERETARLRRSSRWLSLAMIDLDDFKRLNDHYGHLAGDKTLTHLVCILRGALRPSDVLCRFGGEEFVLMLPDTAAEDAYQAVRRLQKAFASQAIPSLDCAVTFSAGVVEHDYFESLDEIIQRADVATYAAKRAGKNRVVLG